MKCLKSNKSVDRFIHKHNNNDFLHLNRRFCINCDLSICKNYDNHPNRYIKVGNNIREVDLSHITIERRIKFYDEYITCDGFELSRYVY